MKNLILVLTMLVSLNTIATCDFKTGITKIGNDAFLYNKACHLETGRLVEESRIRKKQVTDLNKSLTLKDLAINKADDRIKLWQDTTYKLEDRMLKQRKYSKWNDTLTFGGGILVGFLSVWAAGQLIK